MESAATTSLAPRAIAGNRLRQATHAKWRVHQDGECQSLAIEIHDPRLNHADNKTSDARFESVNLTGVPLHQSAEAPVRPAKPPPKMNPQPAPCPCEASGCANCLRWNDLCFVF